MSRGLAVGVEIKFCGMTRAEDVRESVALDADFVGVIFAGGPRTLTIPDAAKLLTTAEGIRTVGVFGDAVPAEVAVAATRLDLDVVQLHGACDTQTIDTVRASFRGEVWAVLRLADGVLPPETKPLFEVANAVVLDARLEGRLGGTGVTLPWERLAEPVAKLRGPAKLVLAGGLRPENVAMAIRLLRPDVVDVSSGVETAPGIKDHARMRAFADAVRRSA